MQEQALTSNSWTDTGANAGETYWYRVSARDASNNESGLSQSFSITVPSTRNLPELGEPQS